MESLSTLPIQNEMTAFISDAAHTWLTGLTKSAQLVFNSPSTLLSVINNGLTFAADTDHSPLDAITTVEKAMYASTIAGIWTAGDYLPVIITDQGVPQKGSGCSGWDPDSIGIDATTNYKGAFKNDVLTKARICDGDDVSSAGAALAKWRSKRGRRSRFSSQKDYADAAIQAYWLLAVFAPHANPAAACVPTPTRPCPVSPNFAQFDNLKNLDGFDGSNWAGLKKEDILFNAVNTCKCLMPRRFFPQAFVPPIC